MPKTARKSDPATSLSRADFLNANQVATYAVHGEGFSKRCPRGTSPLGTPHPPPGIQVRAWEWYRWNYRRPAWCSWKPPTRPPAVRSKVPAVRVTNGVQGANPGGRSYSPPPAVLNGAPGGVAEAPDYSPDRARFASRPRDRRAGFRRFGARPGIQRTLTAGQHVATGGSR